MVEPSSQVKLNCRFYEQKYPNEGDLVQVQVKDIVENGAYVTLTEYDNIEGLITPNEFSKQVNLKNAYKALKVGKTENAIVLKVDQEKGYIDLSKKRVPMEEVKLFEDKVAKAKTVNSILRTVAEKCHTDLDKLYEIIVWPLNKKFGNAHDAFKGALTEPDKYFNELAITPDMKSNLCKEIQRRLTPQPVSIRADFSVQYTGYEGVDAIKEALREGEKKSTKGMELKCNVIAAPNYKMTLTTSDKAGGIQLVKDALQAIDEVIKSKPGGKFEHNPDKQLQVTGEKEEKTVFSEIQEQIEENKDEESETSENNDEDMGNIDVGVDTEEIDRQEEMKKKSKGAAKDEEDDG